MRYTDDELLDEIKRLNEELGHPPTLQNLREYSEYSATTYYNRFGSWNQALESAGFPSREPDSRIDTDSLISELRRLADESGDPPSVTMMNESGEYSASTYKQRFGSWNQALEAAGFTPNSFDTKIPLSDLAAELHRLSQDSDSPPSYEEMEKEGIYGARTYVRRFGSWNDALEYAGFQPANTENKISDTKLREELTRLADSLDKQPSAQEMAEMGDYSVATYQRHFGSWSNALDAVFDDSATRS